MVLHGRRVNVQCSRRTAINGHGVTSATFNNTPDVPFESVEVTLPAGPDSELGANVPTKAKYSLCGQRLVMPTLLKAQNGREIRSTTKIVVTGCPKAKTASAARKLAAALKRCRKKPAGRRASCERVARNSYKAKLRRQLRR